MKDTYNEIAEKYARQVGGVCNCAPCVQGRTAQIRNAISESSQEMLLRIDKLNKSNRKWKRGFWVMVAFVLIIMIFSVFISQPKVSQSQHTTIFAPHDAIQLCEEWAYFQGQKEAINGDVRITKLSTGRYTWTKNPWDGNSLHPIFNPAISEDWQYYFSH